MRIVVSGTHASGKSTLIADFAAAHPGFEVLGDPFEDMDAALDDPDASTYFAQLEVAARRLRRLYPVGDVIAERGPLDFLAYLTALSTLRRPTRASGLLERAAAVTAEAMVSVDLLVLLPLSAGGIPAPSDEDPELRDAMNDALLELADDPGLTGTATVVEITGARATRAAQLEAAASATG